MRRVDNLTYPELEVSKPRQFSSGIPRSPLNEEHVPDDKNW
jgi:hypothetical protein